MTVGKRRAIDRFRRNRELEKRYAEIGRALAADAGSASRPDFDRVFDDDIDDDVLRLIFVACHPVLPVPARVALTLRLLGGLTTAEIARAYLVPEPPSPSASCGRRRRSPRRTSRSRCPTSDERAARLSSVLEVIYLIFNEGYSATAGDDWMRPALCAEALRLGRVLAQLAPAEPEVHGLVALMEIQSSRSPARRAPTASRCCCSTRTGTRWDRLLINRGPGRAGPAPRRWAATRPVRPAGRDRRLSRPGVPAEDTDWPRIVALYADAGAR